MDQEYQHTLSMDGIRDYMRSLFRGLRDIHARGIIHRDIKPANFLFNLRTGIGIIVDLGLACVRIRHYSVPLILTPSHPEDELPRRFSVQSHCALEGPSAWSI